MPDFDKMSVAELQAFIAEEQKRKAQEDVFAQLPKELTSARKPQGLTGPDTGSRTPFMDPANLNDLRDRVLGGVAGSVVGGGPLVGGTLGVMSPPRNKSDWAALTAGGAVASKLAPLVGTMKGLPGYLGAAGAGLAENTASQGARQATGENPDWALTSGISAALPLGAKALFQSPALASKYAKARKFVSDMLGQPTEPTQVAAMPGVTSPASNEKGKTLLSPAGRVFGQTASNITKLEAQKKTILAETMAKAQEFKDRQIGLKEQSTKLRSAIDAAKRAKKRGVGQLEQQFQELEDSYTDPAIDEAVKMVFGESSPQAVQQKFADGISDALDNKASILAARKQIQAAKTGQLRMPEGPLEAEVPNQKIETLQQNLDRTKIAQLKAQKEAANFTSVELPRVQETLRNSPAVDPRLKAFAKTTTPSEFVDELVKTNHENVTALRQQLSPAGRKSLEKTFAQHFTQLAVGPDGNLSNMEAAAKAFPYDKIAAVYGGGLAGRAKADSVQQVVNDTLRQLQSEESNMGAAKRIGARAAGFIPVLMYQLHHASTSPAGLAKSGAALGATVVAVSWPKIIDEAIKSPRFGAQFHKWSTEESVVDALKKYPLVEQFLKDNNEYKPKEKTPE